MDDYKIIVEQEHQRLGANYISVWHVQKKEQKEHINIRRK